MIATVAGYAAHCVVCSLRCDRWWRGADFYACVHDQCTTTLAAWCPALTTRAPAATEVATTVRRGAYARRAGAATIAPSFVPSRFPGYTRFDAWMALAETTIGQVGVPCGANAGHGVMVVRQWEKHAEKRQPITNDGAYAMGAALFSPGGTVAASWGHVPCPGRPVWESLDRVTEWRLCPGCGMYLWPGRWVTHRGRLCGVCADDAERSWPPEPDFPGEASVPDHMRDDMPKRRARRTLKEFRREEHD